MTASGSAPPWGCAPEGPCAPPPSSRSTSRCQSPPPAPALWCAEGCSRPCSPLVMPPRPSKPSREGVEQSPVHTEHADEQRKQRDDPHRRDQVTGPPEPDPHVLGRLHGEHDERRDRQGDENGQGRSGRGLLRPHHQQPYGDAGRGG